MIESRTRADVGYDSTKQPSQFAWRLCGHREVNMEFSISIVLAAVLAADPSRANEPRPAAATCQVIVDGRAVEKLSLQKENDRESGRTQVIYDVRGPSLSLEPGRYRVDRIDLKGGYWHRAAQMDTDWFALSPDQPYHLRAGAPLTSHIDVTREGRLLKLDHRLLDAAGRRYGSTERTSPPCFAVYRDGQEIASGSFEYG